MSSSHLPRLALTLGDPNGIGPEVVLKCFADAALRQTAALVAVGSAAVLQTHADLLGFDGVEVRTAEKMPEQILEDGITVLDVAEGEVPEVGLGKVTEAGGHLAMRAVEVATDLCRQRAADAMVTAPISKEAIARAGYTAPGHTEFIAARTGSSGHTMMMVAEKLRVGLVSGHVPLRAAPEAVTAKSITQKLRIIYQSLSGDFGITRPRVAVLALNPHAGDGGLLGDEEARVIAPALEAAQREGFPAEGPFPADGFFGTRQHEQYDAILAMYHDQGLVPFKALSFGRGVNYTAGLPIVRTSPDHGTAFDIAGQGAASPGSMASAIRLAAQIARRRAATSVSETS